MQKMQRAQQTYQAKYNNVRNVKGDQFDDSKENYEIMADLENTKTNHLLNALSIIIQEFPDFSSIIEGPLADKIDIKIPSRPQSAYERPISQSSQRSQ